MIPIIKLKKIKKDEVQALQEELQVFASHIEMYSLKSDFLTAISTMDIIMHLFVLLNRKMNQTTEYFTISLKVCEAATVIKCYQFSQPNRNVYNENVLRKLNNMIDPELVKLN